MTKLPFSRAVRGFCLGVLSLLVLAGQASAQLSAPSLSNSSTGNELVNGLFDNPTYERESSTQNVGVPNGTTFTTRYFGLVSADCGPACGPKTESMTTNYTVSWNVTAPNLYRVQIDTRRTAGLTCVDEGTGNCVSAMNNAACTPAGGTLVSGGCTLADPADNNTSGTSDVNVNQTNSTIRCGQSLGVAQPHSMNFQWSQSATTPGTGFISVNSDESAVRLGGTSDDTTESAADYPGQGGRTQSNDGHFVTVTYTNLCGNGVVDTCGASAEECDQGGLNGTAGSCCTTSCQFKSNGTTCRGAADVCDQAETCTGASATCPADTFLPPSTVCRATSVGEDCDEAELCTGGSAACPADQVKPFGTLCRGAAGECDLLENCDGVSKFCPADGKKPVNTPCTSDGNPCSLDICNGTSNACQHPAGNAGAVCRAVAGVCDMAETCTGASTTCPADAFLNFTNMCRAAVDTCDIQENCSGSSPNCPPDIVRLNTFVCRPVAGECDVADTCDGVNTACPADVKDPNGTACSSDSNPCTLDQCDGVNNACQHPAGNSGALCRGSAGECDVAETCDGSNTACPPDDKQPGGTPCTSDGELCTLDECDGSSNTCQHPAGNAGVTCRAVSLGDVCDEEEQCDGVNTTCPADDVVVAGTECRAQNGVCDVAEQCDGIAKQCPADGVASNSTPCRPSAGICDVAENCDGTNTTCPVDGFASSGVCRPSAGVCDLADSCDGSGANCPNDDKSTAPCRPSAGLCDVAESCDGVGDDCPGDGFANSGVCRPTAGICDVAESCNGSGANCPIDAFEPNTTECRADAGQCDVAENCTGSSAACPGDGFAADGTPCNDGDICTGNEQCLTGVCGGGTSLCELDHYKCYQGKDLKNPKFIKQTVNTTDQIATNQAVEVKKLKFVCTPVDKNGEGINNPNAHLACYQLKAPTLAPRPSVEVSTQFQTSRFQFKKGKLICLPATKSILP